MKDKELLILLDWIVHRLWVWQHDEERDLVETISALQVVLIPYIEKIEESMNKVSHKELIEWQDNTIELIKNDKELSNVLKNYDLELLFETNEKGNMS